MKDTSSEIRTLHGRQVVLKPLDEDCLLDGELHPSIRLRLERVRELPMTAVANLHGVEVIDGRALLVWEFIPGMTLDEKVASSDQAALAKLKRDLTLIIEQLHSFGIVHGDLHGRNVIIDDRNRLRLTHLSPLLHNDAYVDLNAIDELFPEAIPTPSHEGGEVHAIRTRALAGALVAAVVGILVAVSIISYFSTHS
jgi:tRNA A-37 threonylcarbamoyl transferase component Bud32